MAIKLVETGIPGVDDLCGGGIPQGSVVVVSGPPGVGKSNLVLQFLYNGAVKDQEPGVLFMVEESLKNVREYANEFGWDINKLENEKKMAIIGQAICVKGYSTGTTETLKEVVKEIGAKRIGLDSLTLFQYLFRDKDSRRLNILNFVQQVKDSGCTTMIVSEQHGTISNMQYADEHFIADGYIELFWNRYREKNERCFRVVKMRGCKINPDVRPMEINREGVVVYPTQVPLSLAEQP
ncbi:MAG: hypothetical protein GF334_11565 [Candidatus Altiarchaeales archaeon]|nr:hypothetical protein [Candidatus Altiarchaeales archaeon]